MSSAGLEEEFWDNIGEMNEDDCILLIFPSFLLDSSDICYTKIDEGEKGHI